MRPRLLAIAGILVLAATAWAQDPVADAKDAYRKGEFRKAAKLFATAAEAEGDAGKRAEIRVNLAWTYFAMKNKAKAEEALTAALRDSPQLDLVPDYYTDDFVALFSRVKAKMAAPAPSPGTTPSTVRNPAGATTLTQLRQRLAQAEDNAAVDAVLADLHNLEIAAAPNAVPDILDARAEALDRLGRTNEALELRGRVAALRAVAQAAPGSSAVPLEALLEARRLLATGHPQDAEAWMHGVLTAQPSCVPALEVLGEALLDSGKLDESYSALKTALLGNEKPDLLLLLGEVEERRGRLPGARDAFRRVVEIDPGHDRAWAALGLLGAKMGDLGAAREALDKALQANGTLFEARVVRGEVALADGQPALALQHLQRALQVKPDDPWASGWEGVALLSSGNAAAAVERLRPAAAADPRFALALVEAQRRTGKVDDALATLAAAKSDDPVATPLRARCLLDAGRAAEAEAALTEFLAANPDDARAHYLLGVALHAQRKWNASERELSRAASLSGAPAGTKDALAQVEATRAAQQLLDAALTPPAPAPHR